MLSSNIKNFLITIICLVFILSIILLIFPNGKTKNTLKLVFSIIISISIFMPLLNLKFEINSDSNDDIKYDYSYLTYFSDKKEKEIKEIIEKILAEKNIKDSEITVSFNSNLIEIESITINIKKEIILKKEEHIVFIEEIKKIISNCFLINIDKVEINAI